MSRQHLEFEKERELGEILSDTFGFLRENIRPLSKVVFKVTGPVFIILLLAIGYYSYVGMDIFKNPFLVSENSSLNGGTYLIALFVLLASLVVYYVLLNLAVLHFISSYTENSGHAKEQEVYTGVRKDFGSMLGLLLLSCIIIFFGLMLCFFPGIYLWVPLCIAPSVLVLEGKSGTASIRESFYLIKENWWRSFFTLFVMALLVYIISMIFQLPLIIYFFIKILTTSTEGSAADPASLVDWIYILFNVLSSMAQYLLSTILIVTSALIFYNLREKKYATGSLKRISNLDS